MAKKVRAMVKLQIDAGKATPAPPVGPALGQHGVNIMQFVKEYNEKTAAQMAVYGGLAGVAYDPCYHQACDTILNLNETAFDQMSDAAATALMTLADEKVKPPKPPKPPKAPKAAKAGALGTVGG